MKIIKQKDGTLVITASTPLLLSQGLQADVRQVQQLDEGRLFVRENGTGTGQVETTARFELLMGNPAADRKRERELLAAPHRKLEDGATECYLGRYWVRDAKPNAKNVELVPHPERLMDWKTCQDGQEMLNLAAQSGVDARKLFAASAACARLVIHLARNKPESVRALETMESWCRGEVGEDSMEPAMYENKIAIDAWLERQVPRHDEITFAMAAAACKAGDVVDNVAAAAAAEIGDFAGDMDFRSVQIRQNQIRHFMNAVCGNVIRGIINIEDHPKLQSAIRARNAELSRMPNSPNQFDFAEVAAV